jgi:phosphatidylserine decarboxylase
VRIPLTKYGIVELLLYGGGSLGGLAASAILACTVSPFFWCPAPLFVLMLVFTLNFYRDPSRVTPEGPGLVLSPADGRVVEVAQVDEPRYLKAASHKVAIFMSPLNVHVNRAPCDGQVEAVDHVPGGFRHAAHPEASSGNESVAMTLRAAERDTRLVVRQVAGAVARRIVCGAAAGDRLKRGQRYGMIKFGSRAEVYVPVASGFEVAVAPGDRVKAGETILGRFR